MHVLYYPHDMRYQTDHTSRGLGKGSPRTTRPELKFGRKSRHGQWHLSLAASAFSYIRAMQ